MLVLIRKARIVDPQSEFNGKVLDILIEHGVIKTIAPSIDVKTEQVIDIPGLCVSPGWVDVFADYREPGYEHKETIETGLNAAVAGGFTDVLLGPNTHPAISNKSSVQYVLQKAKGHAVTIHPLGAITQNIEGKDLAEMLDMYTYGAIAFTDGWKPVQNAGLMLKALEYVKSFGGTLIQIPVDAALSSGGLMHEGPISTRLGMAGIPALAETLMVHRDIELLRYTNSRLHISGISCAQSLELVRKAKSEGLMLTCSVTPYHLALTDEALHTYDSVYKVSPPLRSEDDRQALIAGLADGTIDCIASHHRPQEWDAKAKEFEYASEGMNVQENVFNILMEAIGSQVRLDVIIKALTQSPRRIFGLQDAAISEKNKLNLTIFTTDETWTLEKGSIKSMSHNNPFIGKQLKGKVVGILNHTNIFLNQ